MSRQSARSQWSAALGGLTWPLLIGAAATSVFYVLLHEGPLKTPFMHRNFAAHPVLYFETGLFFIGLAALSLKLHDLVQNSIAFGRVELPEANLESVSETCDRALKHLCGMPKPLRTSYLVQRFVNAFEFVERKRVADGVNEELKYLAEQDSDHRRESYSLVRIVGWAIPILGFLGSAIGITQMMSNLDPRTTSDVGRFLQALVSSFRVGLDPMALALVLSMTLMFLMFFANRIESQLLNAVHSLVNAEIAGQFRSEAGREIPYLRSVEKMSQAVIKTTETLIKQQTEQWQAAMADSTQQLGLVAEATGKQVRLAIGESLDHSLKNHADRLARFEFEADQQMRARWDQWQSALADNVRVVRDQQAEVAKQTELISKIARAAGDVTTLEQSLNQNLSALAGAKHFEETVLSLSAAIQLLSAKLAHLPDRPPAVDLRSSVQGKAA